MENRIIVLLLLCIPQLAHADEWRLNKKIDSMTDQEKLTAVVYNNAGHSFSIYRLSDGPVWANFSLSDKTTDTIAADRLPMYRIDKHRPTDLTRLKSMNQLMKAPMHEWQPKWVNFQIWHGQGEPVSGTLRQLLDGERILFRYYLFTGGYKETEFTLVGAKPVIAQALGISGEPNEEAVALDAERRQLIKEAVDQCVAEQMKIKDRTINAPCRERISKCIAEEKKDPGALRGCLQGTSVSNR